MSKRNLLSAIGNKLSRASGMTGLKIRSKKPEIMLIFGIVTMGGAVVSAIRAARKHDSIVEDHLRRLEIAKAPVVVVEAMDGSNDSDVERDQNGDVVRERSEKEIKRAVCKCYLITGLQFAKNWSLTSGLMLVSTLSFIEMYSDMSSSIAVFSGAYMGCKEYIDRYEKRNIELNGIENHEMCKYGYKEIEVEEEDPDNGEKYTVKKKVALNSAEAAVPIEDIKNDPEMLGQFIFVVDRHSSYGYSGIANIDNVWLDSVERYLNDLLNTREWVIVNDVLDDLKMERLDSPAGRAIGWVKGCGPEISLGYNTTMKGLNERFLNGYNDESIIIELNVHGDVNYLRKQLEAKKKEVRLCEQ